jgi:hypothetical protein
MSDLADKSISSFDVGDRVPFLVYLKNACGMYFTIHTIDDMVVVSYITADRQSASTIWIERRTDAIIVGIDDQGEFYSYDI